MIYNISYKTCPKPLHFRFNQINGFTRICDGTRHLVLIGPEKYDAIYNRIRYLSLKGGITDVISHYYVKIKVDYYDSLLIEKTVTLNNAKIFINSVLNKYQNHHYYYIYSQKNVRIN